MPLRILLARLFGRRHRRSEIDIYDEFAAHLDMAAAELRAQGMSAEDAERGARLRFGGLTQTRESYREQSRPPLIESILADLRYAARQLRRNPGFATVAILTLALGIGATTAIYSLVQAVLLRSLPYGHAEQLVYIYTPNAHIPVPAEVMTPTNADFRDIRQSNHSFTDMTQFRQADFNLSTGSAAVRVGAAKVDDRFFSTLELSPQLGRAINAEDSQPGQDHVAVASQYLWHSQFAGTADILKRSINLDGNAYRIIGVMPPDVQYPTTGELPYDNASIHHTDLWIPLVVTPKEAADRENPNFYAIARLKPGISVTLAQTEMSLIMERLDQLHTVDLLGNGGTHGWTALVKSLRDTAVGPVRLLLWLLLGAVCCVLLIACGNAASLLLARAAARSHEFGIRATLGAGRVRVIRQLLTESLLLSSIAGAAGILLAWIFLRLLLRLDPGDIPRLQQASLNLWVLLFVIGLVLVTCLLSGMLPAISVSRMHLVGLLKTSGARGVVAARDRGRNLLMVGEIALVTLLLAGAGLLVRSYIKVTAVQPGFSSSTVTCGVTLDSRYAGRGQGGAFFRRLLDRIARIPGIKSAGAVTVLPFSNAHSVTTLWVDGYRDNKRDTLIDGSGVTPHYFSAMGTSLITGRFFTDADREGSSVVAIVNQSFVRKYFPGQNALGKRLRDSSDSKAPWKSIVGVVADVRNESLDEAPVPQIYTPFDNNQSASIAIRSSLPPEALIGTVRTALRSIDPSIALADIQTMQQAVAASNARRRFQTTLLTIFGAIALLLALVGLYGVLAYSVRQRVPEIGVRIALGASRPRVISMVVRQGLRLVLIGLALGLAAAFILVRFLAGVLYGVSPYDPWTFVAAPALVLLAALIACSAPAWRAAHIEPVEALRSE
jgi:putative ABC transport system permease protein